MAKKRKLRSGYTTGACAAAAAKAASLHLLTGRSREAVVIPFPDGGRVEFAVYRSELAERVARSSIIKDAGDDPDVTNGAEIAAEVRLGSVKSSSCVAGADWRVVICGGSGVGRVTKPGLAVRPGEPAINPVPRRMISEAVCEALGESDCPGPVTVTVSVRDGESLAERTLSSRLGIIGGLSILGTTGIVRPVSAEAWKATIEASLDVAREAGLTEVVLSTGRTSEKAVQSRLTLPEEAYAMMGDYLRFSLVEAAARGFRKIHLAGMWAKVMKAALEVPQTHVRHGALEVRQALGLLGDLGAGPDLLEKLRSANTARELYVRLREAGEGELIRAVCQRARDYAAREAGIPVELYLVDSRCRVIEHE